jgi:four helix bundle protein
VIRIPYLVFRIPEVTMKVAAENQLQGHRDLMAWQVAMDLVVLVYQLTRPFPRDELYGLVAQLRRAAVSIPSNIAEGYGRHSAKELHRFVNNALGSLLELETQIELSQRLGYITAALAADSMKQSRRVKQLLQGLRAWAENEPAGWIPSNQNF